MKKRKTKDVEELHRIAASLIDNGPPIFTPREEMIARCLREGKTPAEVIATLQGAYPFKYMNERSWASFISHTREKLEKLEMAKRRDDQDR
jgi:hypothetical protein